MVHGRDMFYIYNYSNLEVKKVETTSNLSQEILKILIRKDYLSGKGGNNDSKQWAEKSYIFIRNRGLYEHI